jgi:hypothetical protein
MTSERQRPFGPRAERDMRHVESWRAGYDEGFRDGAAAQPDRELFALVEAPWSSVRTEDTVRGDDDALYHVVRSGAVPVSGAGPSAGEPDAGGWIVTLVCGTYREVHQLDHDARVPVLVPVALADALIVSRAGLPGSRLIATRADPGGGFDGDIPWRTEVAGLPRPAG